MVINPTLSAALSGLRANAERANTIADNVVNQNTPGFKPAETRTTSVVTGGPVRQGAGVQTQLATAAGEVDVGLEFSRLIAAEAAYKANAQVIRTADEQARELIDIVG